MIHAIALTGPTASGKTALSLSLAERFSAEIISSDSMQIYKDMDIGTAKATEAERKRVPHHLIDFLSPTEDYSTERYRRDALAAAEDIISRGRLPLFVGGTGLYIDTLRRMPQTDVPESSRELRDKILEGVKTDEDREALWQRLNAIDPESAAEIHKNNLRRVVRAIEIYEATGKPKSYFDRLSRETEPDIRIAMITLDLHDRENLYKRADMRVGDMMREGLLSEVRSLFERGLLPDGSTASQAIGYKELIAHIKGECTLDAAVESLKLATRHYAKRQLTWFRHVTDAYRLYLDTEQGVMRDGSDILREAEDVTYNFIKGFNDEGTRT